MLLLPESPPMAVILLLPNIPGEDVPPPAVHDQREWKEGQLVHSLAEEEVHVVSRVLHRALDKAEGLEVAGRGDGESDRLANRFVET